MFTKYDRAAGAFQDPNVFGPFLALPGIYLLHRLMTGRPLMMAALCGAAAGHRRRHLSSRFRAAPGACSAASSILLDRRTVPAKRKRRLPAAHRCDERRGLPAACLRAADRPADPERGADLFTTRAQLVQDYDGARLGRFARYGIGFMLALEKPFGIGPLVFGQIYGEDTHNIWLKTLMDYGWLGFVAYLTMICWTLAAGFRILFRNRPWQPYLLCAYVVLIGHIALGTVIDTDHWRHFYLLLGLIWGAIGLEHRHQRKSNLPTLG